MNNLASTEKRLRDADERLPKLRVAAWWERAEKSLRDEDDKLRDSLASRIQYVPQRSATWWDVGKIMVTAAIVTFLGCLLLLWKLGAL